MPLEMDTRVAEAGEATLARRVAAAPRLFAPEEARARLESWLADISETPAGSKLRRLLADYPAVSSLITGIAEGSPYLWELARADPPGVCPSRDVNHHAKDSLGAATSPTA